MVNALGIVAITRPEVQAVGPGKYRPMAAYSYVGRYRLVDIPISNMTNSGLQDIRVYTNGDPKVLFDHIGSARHYNINNKHGHVSVIPVVTERYAAEYVSDLAGYRQNLDDIVDDNHEYVVIAPVNWIYKANFEEIIEQHERSHSDVSVLVRHEEGVLDPTKYFNANVVVKKDKDTFGKFVTYIGQPEFGDVVAPDENNIALSEERKADLDELGNPKKNPVKLDISLDTYIMSRKFFLQLVEQAEKYSELFWMTDMLNLLSDLGKANINILNYAYPIFPILDYNTYFNSNMAMLDERNMAFFNDPNWPIYTRTNDSPPTIYKGEGTASGALISNGCEIGGVVRNSILGRNVKVGAGASVDNCIILPGVEIGDGVMLTNVMVDKDAKILRKKEITGTEDKPIYIDRRAAV